MAEITATMVKDLRLKTGAGMSECKKALVEAEGDMNLAIEVLRKKGAASAAKRADRSANEGLIVVLTSDDKKIGAIVEVNCETDFVGKNEGFIEYANTVAKAYLENEVNSVEELMAVKVGSDTIEGMHNEILAKFSEKIEIRRIAKFKSNGFVTAYTHAGSRLGVLIDASIANPSEAVTKTLHDIAMQIAAMNPTFIERANVDQEKINKEIEIYREQSINEGKKPEIADRIAQGRLEKFYQEACLLEQAFVKDNAKTIKDVLAEASADLKIVSFKRFYLGEEIA
jgi:elongation factor Ts